MRKVSLIDMIIYFFLMYMTMYFIGTIVTGVATSTAELKRQDIYSSAMLANLDDEELDISEKKLENVEFRIQSEREHYRPDGSFIKVVELGSSDIKGNIICEVPEELFDTIARDRVYRANLTVLYNNTYINASKIAADALREYQNNSRGIFGPILNSENEQTDSDESNQKLIDTLVDTLFRTKNTHYKVVDIEILWDEFIFEGVLSNEDARQQIKEEHQELVDSYKSPINE